MLVYGHAHEKEEPPRRRTRKIGRESPMEGNPKIRAHGSRQERRKRTMGQPDEGRAQRTCGTWRKGFSWQTQNKKGHEQMSRRRKHRTARGTITRHRGYWCLRFRERIRVGDTIRTIQR